jgi:uncharacterized DUF497 family protein
MAVEFDWNDDKAAKNLRKHRVSFEAVYAFDFDTSVIRSIDFEGGEERIVTVGFIGPKLHVLVHTERGDITRVISLRRAEKPEMRWFYEQL